MKMFGNIKMWIGAAVISASIFGITSCSSVPMTGRNQLSVVPDEQILQLSLAQYQQFMATAPLSTDKKQTQRVKNIANRIAKAADSYLRNNGHAREADKFMWEMNLVKSDQVNAFCMPGGKMVTYEGILPVAPSDDELASVIAHEVAHAFAKHANEKLSNQLVSRYGVAAIAGFIGGGYSTQQIAQLALGMGSKLVYELPYSRKFEYEADKIGLYLMALAGYDYTKSEQFWINMAKRGGSSSDFLSTHPTNQKRIEAIRAEIPRVREFMKNGGRMPISTNAATPTQTTPTKKTTNTGIQTHY